MNCGFKIFRYKKIRVCKVTLDSEVDVDTTTRRATNIDAVKVRQTR